MDWKDICTTNSSAEITLESVKSFIDSLEANYKPIGTFLQSTKPKPIESFTFSNFSDEYLKKSQNARYKSMFFDPKQQYYKEYYDTEYVPTPFLIPLEAISNWKVHNPVEIDPNIEIIEQFLARE